MSTKEYEGRTKQGNKLLRKGKEIRNRSHSMKVSNGKQVRQKEKCLNLKRCGMVCGGLQWKCLDLSHSEEVLGELYGREHLCIGKG